MQNICGYNRRLENLKSERSSFYPLWMELSDYHLAYRGRFLTSNRNKGYKRNTKQINNTSRMASRTLASGMMAGITSPARPWFRLSSGDEELNEVTSVKEWLHEVQGIMYRVFSASNLYNSLHSVYSELGVFGTAAVGIYKDFDNVIWCEPYTIGSYMISTNGKNVVDTFYREYEITVSQCIKQFGFENCSFDVQNRWKNGNTESWVKIIRAIEPNDDRDHMNPLAKYKKFRAVYYERGIASNDPGRGGGGIREQDKFLRESGFGDFPILAPRWDLAGGDIYATDCPGMTSLGDTKSLQLGEKRLYEAVDITVSPPLQGDASLKDKVNGGQLRSGQIVWSSGEGKGLESIYKFQPDLNAIWQLNDRTENRIQRAFYEDLFLMLANTDRKQITAREVAEKHEEKLLMLGPVLERLHNELLDPLIDRTFNILQEEGVLPPPPPELSGRDLNVEYVSVLAQAQRMVATGSLERLGAFTAELSQVWPGARHKFDAAQAVDEYADALGTSPKVVRSDDEVAAMEAADAKALAQQQAMEQGQQLADTAKTASDTEIKEGNALGNMMEQAGLT